MVNNARTDAYAYLRRRRVSERCGSGQCDAGKSASAMKSRRFMRFEYKEPSQVEMHSICCRMRGVRLQLLRSTGIPG